jgi:hypothetical protein
MPALVYFDRVSVSICPNCGSGMEQEQQYCGTCGQVVIRNEGIGGFIEQFVGDYFTFDSKIVRSLVPLLVRPGVLTDEYMKGRRARYIAPLRMFIFLSILFFLVIGWSGGAGGNMAPEDLQDHFFWDNFFTSILPKLFFLFLPLFALLVHLLYQERPRNFVKPFVLSAHFHAFVFLGLTFYVLLSRLFLHWDLVNVNLMLVSMFLVYTFIYLWVALRKVYPRPSARQFLLFSTLLGLYTITLAVSAVLAVWILH